MAVTTKKRFTWANFVNVVAMVGAIAVFAAGVLLVVLPAWSDSVPSSVPAKTITDETTNEPPTVTTDHKVDTTDQKTTTTDSSTTVQAKSSTKHTEVTTGESQSLIERYLTKGHLGVFVLFGIVSLAAFLAGAVIQRIGRGQYAITLGPVELPAIAEAAAQTGAAVEALSKHVAKQKRHTRRAIHGAADAATGPAADEMRAAAEGLEDDKDLDLVDEHLQRARQALREAGVSPSDRY